MRSAADLRTYAAMLRELADRAPTWEHRTELLRIAVGYDRLAEIAGARDDGRAVPVGNS
jgi:hypothetical protein